MISALGRSSAIQKRSARRAIEGKRRCLRTLLPPSLPHAACPPSRDEGGTHTPRWYSDRTDATLLSPDFRSWIIARLSRVLEGPSLSIKRETPVVAGFCVC